MDEYDSRIVLDTKITLSPETGNRIKVFKLSLPDDIWSIEIRCIPLSSTKGKLQCLLHDPERLRGYAADPEESLFLAEDWASENFLPGDLPKGEWTLSVKTPVLHGSMRCGDFPVGITILIRENQTRCLRGDLHMHSHHSDGTFSPGQIVSHAREIGLDFISITDHNQTAQNYEELNSSAITVIPGSEYSTAKGDVNIFGVKEPYSLPPGNSSDDVMRIITSCRERRAIVSVNHPFHKVNGWGWGFDPYDFEYAEIWRSTWKQHNTQALKWWHKQLCLGKRIVGLGGSDVHHSKQDHWFGTPPTTRVWADKPTTAGILEGIRSGRVSISNHPDGSYLDLYINGNPEMMMGRTVFSKSKTDLEVTVLIHNFIPGNLKVISNKGVIISQVLKTPQTGGVRSMTVKIDREAFFCRAEYWPISKDDNPSEPYCISNPIFISEIAN